MSNTPIKPDEKINHWRERFRGTPRKPRPWNIEVNGLLHDCWPTRVFLREHTKTTDIVLRLPISSKKLSQKVQKQYFGQGTALRTAFDEIIWVAPEKRKHSAWARLAKAAYDAYWAAWIHLLDVEYAQHGFPSGNKQTEIWLTELKASRHPRNSAGRRSELDAEREYCRRRYKQLLKWCKDLHKFVKTCNEGKLSQEVLGRLVFEKIHWHRHDHNVLSGKAFCWSKNSKEPVLHDSATWAPQELACALFALERYGTPQAYDNVLRKIRANFEQSPTAKS